MGSLSPRSEDFILGKELKIRFGFFQEIKSESETNFSKLWSRSEIAGESKFVVFLFQFPKILHAIRGIISISLSRKNQMEKISLFQEMKSETEK